MAGPSSFFDPFFRIQETANLLDAVNLSDETKTPAKYVSDDGDHDLPIKGQGTISLSSDAKELLRFELRPANGKRSLFLDIGTKDCQLYEADKSSDDPLKYQPPVGSKVLPYRYLKKSEDAAIRSGQKTTYWLSLDRSNGIIMYGKYYTNRSMALLQAELKETKGGVKVWKQKEYEWLETLKEVYAIQDPKDEEKVLPKMKIHPLPVVIDQSPFVISDQQISLLQLEKGDFTIFANLPQACQTLYHNVAGPNITLETEDFPFTAAIQRSVSTPGLWGYETLKSKAKEFGKDDPKGTYLRITLGTNQGDSPGVPYVLEIWPGGHYSPIHDHGDACAVIKVLHGMINATFYDSLTSPGGPHEIQTAELREGMVTWIGPNNYQIHKLHNDTESVCCTIQCYRFADDDREHYEKFNYVDAEGNEKAFNPNSDKAFKDFQDLMRKEWGDWKATLAKQRGGK